MEVRSRAILIVLLLLVVFGLTVHYGATAEQAWPYPSGDQLAEEPDGWDGRTVLLFGTVRDVEPAAETLTMEIETDAGDIARVVEVRGTTARVEPGGVVQVYGELDDAGTVQQATAVVVVNESPTDQIYKLVTSLLGVLLAMGLFLRFWRIDLSRLRFVSRGGRSG